MELEVYIGIAAALFAVLMALLYWQKKQIKYVKVEAPQQQRGVPQRAQEGVPRRAQIVRNQRNRMRQNAAAAPVAAENARPLHNVDDDDDDSDLDMPHAQVLTENMGAKKRAKLEAKEQKKQMREQQQRMRDEKKAKDAVLEEERKKQEDLEAEAERKKAEAERLAREEQERREHEEYLKMKAAFSVEEEGYDEAGDEEKESLLADFIKYIKDNKVVVLEDLATEFKLKTQQAIERIQEMQANGTITGVIDDRGKFIYISEEELQSVAKFIRQRGRVSIAELAESSNNLINLTPVATN